MRPKFITDHPALMLGRRLVVADLHIGMEYELYGQGVKIPSQTGIMLKKLAELITAYGARTLTLLGDVKHNIPVASFGEKRELPNFFEQLSRLADVEIIPGNHDGDIGMFMGGGVKTYPSEGARVGSAFLNHGHSWPGPKVVDCDYLVMGHAHPAIEFRNAVGYRAIEPVWITASLGKNKLGKRYKKRVSGELKIIIMPAFSHLIGGVAFNALENGKLIGPVTKMIKLDDAHAYLLDGTALGRIKNLKNVGKGS